MISREKCLELCRECGIEFDTHIGISGKHNVLTIGSQRIEKMEALINRTYQEGQKDNEMAKQLEYERGQRDMRERAANKVDLHADTWMVQMIRDLEIE